MDVSGLAESEGSRGVSADSVSGVVVRERKRRRRREREEERGKALAGHGQVK